MYRIYEDDYAQTAFPRSDSDGAVELFWDHPQYPNQWSGRYCEEFPYEDWKEIRPLIEDDKFGVWSPSNIILLHFNLYNRINIPKKTLYLLSPSILLLTSELIEKFEKIEDKNERKMLRNLILDYLSSKENI